jgi:hypothetical protein
VIPAFPVYLFDLDGTLVDSALDICGAVQQVLSETEERPDVSFEFLKGYIGRHLIDLFGDLYPHYSPQQVDRMIVDYRAIYLARGHTRTQLYPGVAEALSKLSGRKATATTKGTPTTRAVLHRNRRHSLETGAGRSVGCAGRSRWGAVRVPDGGRFSRRHGSRPAGGRQDLRRAIRLRKAGRPEQVGAGLLGVGPAGTVGV